MVLESIIGEKRIRKNPVLIFFVTFAISLVSILFADLIFPKHGSVLSIAFITIGLVPVVFNILSSEQSEEVIERKSAVTFFARHFNLLMLYVWIFVGIIVAFAIAYSFSPVSERGLWFEEQTKSFCAISGSTSCTNGVPNSISGRATAGAFSACQNPSTSNVTDCTVFILQNNAGVLIFILLLSIFYGVGAIFIIAWNASILGVFFGEMFLVGEHLRSFGFLQGMLIGHGPPELLAYVFGAIAGAILSASIAKGDFFRHGAMDVAKDIGFLVILAFFSVLYGALTEAVGIMGLAELYYILGFVYVLLIILAVFVYGKKQGKSKALAF
jgi:hypothetical protein